jgi:hypothetical protein
MQGRRRQYFEVDIAGNNVFYNVENVIVKSVVQNVGITCDLMQDVKLQLKEITIVYYKKFQLLSKERDSK